MSADHKFNINKTTYNIYKYTAMLSFAVIFMLGVAFLQPFSFSENTNATTERTTNGDYYLETTSTDLNLTIETTPAGNQISSSHDVTVKTDDPAGYTLTVSVNNDTSNALNLNGNTAATEKFAATSGTYDSPKALDENSWGFADTLAKFTNDQWAAVPLLSNAQQLKSTSAANTSGDTTTIYYAVNAKYDGAHSNGNYSNTITYSVVGNTIPKNPMVNNMNMQDVTQEMCADSDSYDETGTTYTLIDSRDSSDYQVRKLADGNCWMVQNLRLINKKLTTSDSNVSSDFTIPASSTSSGSNTGQWGENMDASGINHTAAYYNNDTSYGAYYNWYTATASSGTYSTASGVSVDYSICPKSGSGNTKTTSWHLPTGGAVPSGSATGSEWYEVFKRGGITYLNRDGQNTPFDTKVGPISPFSLVLSGEMATGLLSVTGSYDGYFWSSTAQSASYGYSTGVYSDGRLYAGTDDRGKRLGFSVRCVLTSS